MPIFQDECNVKKDLAILIKHESDKKFAESPAQSRPFTEPSTEFNIRKDGRADDGYRISGH